MIFTYASQPFAHGLPFGKRVRWLWGDALNNLARRDVGLSRNSVNTFFTDFTETPAGAWHKCLYNFSNLPSAFGSVTGALQVKFSQTYAAGLPSMGVIARMASFFPPR